VSIKFSEQNDLAEAILVAQASFCPFGSQNQPPKERLKPNEVKAERSEG
jgi:hypothetical protein